MKRREEQAQLERTARQGFTIGVNQYYDIGALIALGVIGDLGNYIYHTKKGEVPNNPPQQPWGSAVTLGLEGPRSQVIVAQAQTNKFEMD